LMWAHQFSHSKAGAILIDVSTESNVLRRLNMGKGKKEKALDHKHHMKLQRDKDLKKKEKRNVELPAEYGKSKK